MSQHLLPALCLLAVATSPLAAVTVYDPHHVPPTTSPRLVLTPPQVQHIDGEVTVRRDGSVSYRPSQVVYQAPQATYVEHVRRRGHVYRRTTTSTTPGRVHTTHESVHHRSHRGHVRPRYRGHHHSRHHGHHHRGHRHQRPSRRGCHVRPRFHVGATFGHHPRIHLGFGY